MSKPKISKERPPLRPNRPFWQRISSSHGNTKWKRQPLAPKISGALIALSFFSFMPLFVWKHSNRLLAFAAGMAFITFVFVGAASLFGSPQTVVSIAWGGRRNASDNGAVLFGRIMGGIFLGFMTFITYEILRGGVPAASKNLGW